MAALAQLTRALSPVLQPFYFNALTPLILGVTFVGLAREFLATERLYEYNTEAALQYGQNCTPRELRFRTMDGHCNNLNQTGMGMSNLRFGRHALKDPRIPDPGLFQPEPYLVAERLLKARNNVRTTAPAYNLFMASWINLMFHDWFNHDVVDREPYSLKVGPGVNDVFRLKRTARDEQGFTINTETPWWDAGQIYGKTDEQAASLRAGGQCELALNAEGLLPLGPDGVPLGGFVRNWWTGLEMLQHLFVLEHNYVCGMARAANPDWTEDDLFDLTRLIVAAIMAKIHTIEWTPALLNNDVMNITMHNSWQGISRAFLESETIRIRRDRRLTAVVRQQLLRAIQELDITNTRGVGDKTELNGKPYTLSEDFVSAYRLHPLLPDNFTISGEQVGATDMLEAKSRNVIQRFGLGPLMDSWGHQAPTTLTLNNYPNFLTQLTTPGGVMNLGAVDIFRDRERGVPRYNQARRQYGITPARNWRDISTNPQVQVALRSVYRSVEEVDFMVGCLAESPRPKGYAISNVAFYVFIINASRRLLCDRFYQESYNNATYTPQGLQHVEATTFKKLLIRHYPQLEGSIGDVSNAFMAWTGTPQSGRH